jgi:DNA-binding transcriptional MerR regulator
MVYSILEVAKRLGVSRESLRNWEKQGFIPKPHRRPTNFREYTDADLEAIRTFLSQKNLVN